MTTLTAISGPAFLKQRLRRTVPEDLVDDDTLLGLVNKGYQRACERGQCLPAIGTVYDQKGQQLVALPDDLAELVAVYRAGQPQQLLPVDAALRGEQAGYFLLGGLLGLSPAPSEGLVDPAPIISDSFARVSALSDTFGTSTSGLAWQRSGSGVVYQVNGTVGLVGPIPSSSASLFQLSPVSEQDANQVVTLAALAASDGTAELNFGLVSDFAGPNHYRVVLVTSPADPTLRLRLVRRFAATTTTLAEVVLDSNYTLAEEWRVRYLRVGSEHRARAWRAAVAEPDEWPIDTLDSSAIGGQIGLFFRQTQGATSSQPTVTVRDYAATTSGDVPTAETPRSLVAYYRTPAPIASWDDSFDEAFGPDQEHLAYHYAKSRAYAMIGGEQRSQAAQFEEAQFLAGVQRLRARSVQWNAAQTEHLLAGVGEQRGR